MKTTYDTTEIFANNKVLCYCENYGIYEVYSIRGNVLTYYSYFGSDGLYKITHNIKNGKEIRKRLRYNKVPKFLIAENGGTKYNYFCG